ncbi:MAG: ABC transporter permease [Bdellovibrionaceae bacterium]|nr:ABC transporter permease [Pseudobdellovibrionaceae bacterium]
MKIKSIYKKIYEKKTCFYCGLGIVLTCFLALFAPFISPYPFDEQFPEKALNSYSWTHFLGTDHLGRDLLSRVIYGARMSMAVGIFTALISAFLGIIYGLISGWLGGLTDRILMRFIDIMFSIPTLVLLILVKVLFDSFTIISNPELKALAGTLVALSLVSWASLARVVRGQVLQSKENLFVEASRSLGAGNFRIIFIHILPNIISPIIILLTFQIPSNILFESMLSFLGLGLQAPFSSWGVLIDEGWRSISTYPRLIIVPGFMLFVTMLSFNLFGDGLRDIFDPNLKNQI